MTHQIDISKGELRSDVSYQWATRPDDEKFLSLDELYDFCKSTADASYSSPMTSREIVAKANGLHDLTFDIGGEAEMTVSNYGFRSLAAAAGAPYKYLPKLPAPLAAAALNYGFRSEKEKALAAYILNGKSKKLRGMVSRKYGRIHDHEVVEAVRNFVNNATDGARWKVPGVIDWSNQFGISYNPNVDVTKQTTTLFASDRDCFIFLVDDLNPIEVGKLANGQPDLMFRGMWTRNSEVGFSRYSAAAMYMRGVCQNRNLWGVEGFKEISFKHTPGAPVRFADEVGPSLESFSNGSTMKVIEGVKAAKAAKVASDDDERITFLTDKADIASVAQAKLIVQTGEIEEGRKPETIWDMAQAITAFARTIPYTNERIDLEKMAGKLLDKVAA